MIPPFSYATFRTGAKYRDIIGYRKQLLTDADRDRFVRCFIAKLLTYAKGVEPGDADFVEIDRILFRWPEQEYGIIDTIAAVVDSPMFREE